MKYGTQDIVCSQRYTDIQEYRRWRAFNSIDPCSFLASRKQDTDDGTKRLLFPEVKSAVRGPWTHTRSLSVSFEDCNRCLLTRLLYILRHWEVPQVHNIGKCEVVPVPRFDWDIGIEGIRRREPRVSQLEGTNAALGTDAQQTPRNKLDDEGNEPLFVILEYV